MTSTAIEIKGHVTLGHEPKTRRSKRTIPVARSVTERLQTHVDEFVGDRADSLVFSSPLGMPLVRSNFSRRVWQPTTVQAGLEGVTLRAAAQLRRHTRRRRMQRP